MQKTASKLLICFAIAIVVNWVATILQSDYPAKFLEDKIVELLITLMAINTATASLILSKLEEISKNFNVTLPNTVSEVKKSIILQLWLIGVSIVCLILFNSKIVHLIMPNTYKSILDTALLTIFICALDILRDTGIAIFLINEAIRSNKPGK